MCPWSGLLGLKGPGNMVLSPIHKIMRDSFPKEQSMEQHICKYTTVNS